MLRKLVSLVVLSLSVISLHAEVPQQTLPAKSPAYYTQPYGLPIGLELAKKIGDAALNHGMQNGQLMSVAIVDTSGNLVYFVRADNNQTGGPVVAIKKAKAAALFKRPTKVFSDSLASGGAGLSTLALEGAVALDGGLPIIVDGKVVGAIGVAGDLAFNDGLAAAAGLVAMVK
jgi:uncharacterized protein GlcG (DUF336 family)